MLCYHKSIVVLLLCIKFAVNAAPTVETKLGTIVGSVKEVDVFGKQMKVHRFHGIPYAEPPVGELRFQKPVPKKSLTSPYDASKHGNICYQVKLFPDEGMTYSEDCLHLNVYAPAERKQDLAVMVWIHGGGMACGASNYYLSDTLAAYGDVIIVTINYRVTLWGFLSTGDENAPGNIGLWDQHLAIKWVHDNIKSFGGDPNTVTVFGESAGGMSTTYQSLYGGNKGLYQRAIAQSGSLWVTFIKDPKKDALKLGKLVGCEQTESGPLVQCLQSLSAEILDETMNNYTNGLFDIPVPFLPSIDGEFFKEHPRNLLYSENDGSSFFSEIDFMAGLCGEEGVAMLSPFTGVNDPENFEPNQTTFKKEVVPGSLAMAFNTGEPIPGALTEVVAHEYTDWSDPYSMEKIRSKAIQLLTDMMFGAPMLLALSKHTALAKSDKSTYMYIFDAAPTKTLLPTPSWFKGATHGDEMMYLFFGEDLELIRLMPGHEDHQIQDWERDVAKHIMTLWTNFAKTGNPNKPMPVKMDWPTYTEDRQQYFKISRETTTESVQSHLHPREANLWNEIVPSLSSAIGNNDMTVSKMDTGYCEKDGGCKP